MKEYQINKYITLRLERNNTIIYVNNERFDICHFLLMNIPTKEVGSYDTIESIDEAADRLGWTDDGQEFDDDYIQDAEEHLIDSETEFFGHCSNIEAWVKNNYNTEILHSNLSFPLLKRLTEVGDPVAKKVFRKEIAKRLESGYPSVVTYLSEEGYLKFLPSDFLDGLFDNPEFLKKFLSYSQANIYVKHIIGFYIQYLESEQNQQIATPALDNEWYIRLFERTFLRPSEDDGDDLELHILNRIKHRLRIVPRSLTLQNLKNLFSLLIFEDIKVKSNNKVFSYRDELKREVKIFNLIFFRAHEGLTEEEIISVLDIDKKTLSAGILNLLEKGLLDIKVKHVSIVDLMDKLKEKIERLKNAQEDITFDKDSTKNLFHINKGILDFYFQLYFKKSYDDITKELDVLVNR